MNNEFIFIALGAISVCTTATVEGIKKLLDEAQKTYAPNLLAAIVAIVLTVAASIGYVIYNDISVTPKVIVEAIAIVFLSFLCSTVGFDKIKQLWAQLSVK